MAARKRPHLKLVKGSTSGRARRTAAATDTKQVNRADHVLLMVELYLDDVEEYGNDTSETDRVVRIARRLGCSERTLWRYLETARDAQLL